MWLLQPTGRYTEANHAYQHHQSKVVYYQYGYFGFYSSGCVTLKIKSGFNNEELRCNCRLNHCRKHCSMDNLMFSTTFDHNRVNNGGIWRGSFLPWSRHAECSQYSMNKQRNQGCAKYNWTAIKVFWLSRYGKHVLKKRGIKFFGSVNEEKYFSERCWRGKTHYTE